MEVADRKAKEKQALRGKILEAGRSLFAAEGYEAVTMRKIAQEIGYTATTLYSYFEDKDALLRAICEDDFLSLRSQFQEIAKDTDPVEKLRAIGLAYVKYAIDYPNQYRLMFMTVKPESCNKTEIIRKGDPDQDAYAFLKSVVEEAIHQRKLRPELTDADTVAQILWAGAHGLVSLHVVYAHDDWLDWKPVEQTAAQMIEVTLRGLLAERPAGKPKGAKR